MAHFAQLQNGTVINVIVVNNDVLIDNTGNEMENLGIEFCKELFGQDTQWKQTSYNTKNGKHLNDKVPLRGNYAIIGGTYDEQLDAFLPPKPYASWVLNDQDYEWESPIKHPNPDYPETYLWDEDSVSWVLAPSPYASWILNDETKEWEPPIAAPDDGMIYRWDEDSTSWEFVGDPADLVDQ